MGPTVTRPVQDPLAVLCLKNRLYMSPISPVFYNVVTARLCLKTLLEWKHITMKYKHFKFKHARPENFESNA